MTKILVTGGAGAAGSLITEALLAKGYDVTVWDIVPKASAVYLADVLDKIDYHWKSTEDIIRDDVRKYEAILDFVSQGDSPLGITSPKHTLHRNLDGLLGIMEAIRTYGPDVLYVYPSSGTQFGYPEYMPIDEKHPPTPTHPYAASKSIAEIVIKMYSKFAPGINYVIFRNGIVYGPRMRRGMSIAEWIVKTLKGIPIRCESPNVTRDPTYNADITQPWLKVIEMWLQDKESIKNQVFQISYGKEYTVKALCHMTVRAAGGDPNKIEWGEPRVGERLVRENFTNEKARKMLGYNPQIDFPEGVKKTVEWFKSHI